jgi:hypothetical protein
VTLHIHNMGSISIPYVVHSDGSFTVILDDESDRNAIYLAFQGSEMRARLYNETWPLKVGASWLYG